MDKLMKVKEFTYEETLEQVKEETPEFLAEYIYKINHTYNLMLERILDLEEKNRLLNQMNIDNYNKYCELLKNKKGE